ncbi:hypothetical protein EDD22DRAFT_917818 [Suillus occidentalis]|nr:hypothetical protein EDD22DRAFT_917818 [Suillus occidentalis]
MAVSCQTFGSLEQFSLVDYSFTSWWDFGGTLGLTNYSTPIFSGLCSSSEACRLSFSMISDTTALTTCSLRIPCPGLRELRFVSEKFDSRAVTFAAVLSLASKCRSPRNLQFTFDATQFPTLPCAGRDSRTLAHANSPPRAACRTFERVGAVAAFPLPSCGFSESGSSHTV